MTKAETDRIIEMAWEDKTTFEAIKIQFGFTEADVISPSRRTVPDVNEWEQGIGRRRPDILYLRVSK